MFSLHIFVLQDMERTLSGEVVQENIDNLEPFSPASTVTESEFNYPSSQPAVISKQPKSEEQEGQKEQMEFAEESNKRLHRNLKSVLKKTGPTPVLTVQASSGNTSKGSSDGDSRGEERRVGGPTSGRECCVIS